MSDSVQLTDLEVITRYSLAVRTASAERADVIAALKADIAWLEGRRSGTSRPAPDQQDSAPAESEGASTARRSAPAKKAAAVKRTVKKAATKKTASRGR